MLGDWIGQRIDYGASGEVPGGTILWHGTYILDGWAVRTDWESHPPGATVQRGTMLRTFDQRRHEWRIAETYSLHPRLDVFNGWAIGDSLIQSSVHDTPTGRLLARRVYFRIQANHFEDRVETSMDGGRTWTHEFRESFERAK
jgi:hypothetical protein